MKVFLDTNVLLDYLLNREGFAEYAMQLLLLGNAKEIDLCVADLSISNIAYITRETISKEDFYDVMKKLSRCYTIVSMGKKVVNQALDAQWSDFEDALQYYTALNAGADVIITRNAKDFKQAELPVMTASEYLAHLEDE